MIVTRRPNFLDTPAQRPLAPYVFTLQEFACHSRERRLIGPINLGIDFGLTAIVGPNGSGKSTFLQALAGVAATALRMSGKIGYQGQVLDAMHIAKRAREIAWLAQDTQTAQGSGTFLTSLLTVQGLVELAALAQAGWQSEADRGFTKNLEHHLKDFDLSELRHTAIEKISGGELQRAQLARVFAVQSPTLLLDEPSNHLDLQHQRSLEQVMSQRSGRAGKGQPELTGLQEQSQGLQQACIFSTHDLNLALLADHILLMKNGEICGKLNLAQDSDQDIEAQLLACFDTPVRVIRFEGQRLAIKK
jgi:ABC-type cobalamin/Fe3+-siderophores transport system ATPase subunit